MRITEIKKDILGLLEKSAGFYVIADKWDFMLNEMLKTAKQKYPEMTDEDVKNDLETLKNADTSQDKRSIRFLVKIWMQDKNQLLQELQMIMNNLNVFYRQRNKESWKMRNKPTDVMALVDKAGNGFKTIENLVDVVADEIGDLGAVSLNLTPEETAYINDEKNARHIYNQGEWDIYIPLTEKASQLIGRGAKFCTSQENDNCRFNDYKSRGVELYMIKNKYNPELIFQFEGDGTGYGQFADKNNQNVKRFTWLIKDENLYNFIKPHLNEEQEAIIDKNRQFINLNSKDRMSIIESGDESKIIDLIENVDLTENEVQKVIDLYAQ